MTETAKMKLEILEYTQNDDFNINGLAIKLNDLTRYVENQGQTLPIASVSAFVCPDCKGSNMAESNKREMWCNDCEENYRENEC